MERTIDTVRETPHWSYSAFNTYLTCPMRYYFRYIEHAEVERTSVNMPFGRAFHAVLSERARKGSSYTIEEAKDDFAVYFKGETEVSENLSLFFCKCFIVQGALRLELPVRTLPSLRKTTKERK